MPLPAAGDAGKVTVGSGSNLQDGTVVRTQETRLGPGVLPGPHPDTVIGNNVTVGHQVVEPTVTSCEDFPCLRLRMASCGSATACCGMRHETLPPQPACNMAAKADLAPG